MLENQLYQFCDWFPTINCFKYTWHDNDSIEIEFEWNGDRLILIDTAGIRRKGKVSQKEEKFALLKSLESAATANFIFIMIDATEGITAQDQAIISEALNLYTTNDLLINKWDLMNDYQKREI